jgi:hypothetical protein
MKNPTLVIGSLAVLAIAGLAAILIGLPGHHQGKQDADVTLNGTGTACAIDPKVGLLGGKKDTKFKWQVVNNCDTPQYVTFLVYREKVGNGTYGSPEHVVDRDPVSSKSLAATGGKDTVDAKIDKDNSNLYFDKEFKYFVCFGATANPVPDPIKNPSPNCLDPDIDVWP